MSLLISEIKNILPLNFLGLIASQPNVAINFLLRTEEQKKKFNLVLENLPTPSPAKIWTEPAMKMMKKKTFISNFSDEATKNFTLLS